MAIIEEAIGKQQSQEPDKKTQEAIGNAWEQLREGFIKPKNVELPSFGDYNDVAYQQLKARGLKFLDRKGRFTKARHLPIPKYSEGVEGMDNIKAALSKAVLRERNVSKIIVMGDYDADGTLGEAILSSALEQVHKNMQRNTKVEIEPYHPQRSQGFGHLGDIRDKASPDTFLFIVDTGSSKLDELIEIQDPKSDKRFAGIAILDHHPVTFPKKLFEEGTADNQYETLQEKLEPYDIWISNHTLESEPIKQSKKTPLSGGGMAEIFARHMLSVDTPDIRVMGALATIGDQVELTKDNLAIVEEALQIIHENVDSIQSQGLKDLIEKAVPKVYKNGKQSGLRDIKDLNTEDIAFNLIPMINSLNRMEYSQEFQEQTGYASGAQAMADYLLGRTPKDKTINSKIIEHFNDQRKDLTNRLATSTFKYLNMLAGDDPDFWKEIQGLVLLNSDIAYEKIPSSIAGLIASSVVEKTGKPTIVLTTEKKDGKTTFKGSGRAPQGYSISAQFEEVRKSLAEEKLWIGGGGHAGAIGVSFSDFEMKAFHTFQRFQDLFAETPAKKIEGAVTDPPPIQIDPKDITDDFIKEMKKLQDAMGPTGVGNPALQFKGTFNLSNQTEDESGNHLFFNADVGARGTQRVPYFFGGKFGDKIPATEQEAIYGIRIFEEDGGHLSYEIKIQSIENLLDDNLSDKSLKSVEDQSRRSREQEPEEPKTSGESPVQDIVKRHKPPEISSEIREKIGTGPLTYIIEDALSSDTVNLKHDPEREVAWLDTHMLGNWATAKTPDELNNTIGRDTYDIYEPIVSDLNKERLKALQKDLQQSGITVPTIEGSTARDQFFSIIGQLESGKYTVSEPFPSFEDDHYDGPIFQEESYEEPKRSAEGGIAIKSDELYLKPDPKKNKGAKKILEAYRKNYEGIDKTVLDQYGGEKSPIGSYVKKLMSIGRWTPDLAETFARDNFHEDFLELDDDGISGFYNIGKSILTGEQLQAVERAKEINAEDGGKSFKLFKDLQEAAKTAFADELKSLKKAIKMEFGNQFKYNQKIATARGVEATASVYQTYDEHLRQLSDYPYDAEKLSAIVNKIADNFGLRSDMQSVRSRGSYSSQYQWLMHEGAEKYAERIVPDQYKEIKARDPNFRFSGIFTAEDPQSWLEQQLGFVTEDLKTLDLYAPENKESETRSVRERLRDARTKLIDENDILTLASKLDDEPNKEMTALEDAFLYALSDKWKSGKGIEEQDQEVKEAAELYLSWLPGYSDYPKKTATTANPEGRTYNPGKSPPRYWRENLLKAVDSVTDKAKDIESLDELSAKFEKRGLKEPEEWNEQTPEVQKRRYMNLALMNQGSFEAAVQEKQENFKRRQELQQKKNLTDEEKEELNQLRDQNQEIWRNREAWGLTPYEVQVEEGKKETRYRLQGITRFTGKDGVERMYREGIDQLPSKEELEGYEPEELTELYNRGKNKFYLSSVLNPEADQDKPYLVEYTQYNGLLYKKGSEKLKAVVREEIMAASFDDLQEKLTTHAKPEGGELTEEQEKHNMEAWTRINNLDTYDKTVDDKTYKLHKDYTSVTLDDKKTFKYYRLHDLLGVSREDLLKILPEDLDSVEHFGEIVDTYHKELNLEIDTVEGFTKFFQVEDKNLSAVRWRMYGLDTYTYKDSDGTEKQGHRLRGTRKIGDLIYREQDMREEIEDLEKKIPELWEERIQQVEKSSDLDTLKKRLLNLRALTMPRNEFTAARTSRSEEGESAQLKTDRQAVYSLDWKDEQYQDGNVTRTKRVLEGAVSVKIGDKTEWFREGIDDLEDRKEKKIEDLKKQGIITDTDVDQIKADLDKKKLSDFQKTAEIFRQVGWHEERFSENQELRKKLEGMSHTEWFEAVMFHTPEGTEFEDYIKTPEGKEILKNRMAWGFTEKASGGYTHKIPNDAFSFNGVWYRKGEQYTTDQADLKKAVEEARQKLERLITELDEQGKRVDDLKPKTDNISELDNALFRAEWRKKNSSPKTSTGEIAKRVVEDASVDQDMSAFENVLQNIRTAGEQAADTAKQKADQGIDIGLNFIFGEDSRNDPPIQEPEKTKRTRGVLERMISSKGHMMKPMLGFIGTVGAVTLFDAAFSKPKDDWEFYKQRRQQEGRPPIGYAW